MRQNDNNSEIKGLSVEVRNGDVNYALRKFKKKVSDSGILQELKEKEFYEKPSIKRAKAKKAARSRWLKQVSKMNEIIPHSTQKRK